MKLQMYDKEFKEALVASVIATPIAAILWAIIEIKGVHTDPRVEMGALQIVEYIAGLLAGLALLFVVGFLIIEVFMRPHRLRQPIRVLGVTLNLLLVFCSLLVMFSRKGTIARMVVSGGMCLQC